MRQLASIQEIREIKEHTNADSLELAVVLGWQVVVKKGEFKPGQAVVYFEIDSVLPIEPQYEFLRKSCYRKLPWLSKGEGFRLKTVRLRKEISQGLVLSVDTCFQNHNTALTVGQDVTDLLRVEKYEPPVPAQLAGQVRRNFPPFLHKSDQIRAQSISDTIFSDYKDKLFEVTLKLDGSSCTAYYNSGDVGICSRNLELKINEENKDNSFIKTCTEGKLLDALKNIGRNVAVQGELMGPGIQGNREKLEHFCLFIFDIFDIDTQQYVSPEQRNNLFNLLVANGIDQTYVKHVPVHAFLNINQFSNVSELLAIADGRSLNHDVREGLVWKCVEDPNFSFKTISNKFLLEYEE